MESSMRETRPAAQDTSTATTQGVRVDVRATYIADQSAPAQKRYVFAYNIRVSNVGSARVQLVSRHWIITDSGGQVEEVRGPGVVGKQPTLGPGEAFEYTSGCVLKTSAGEMRGTYQMVTDEGLPFDASIAPFRLGLPHTLN
jgi:ApaG protein